MQRQPRAQSTSCSRGVTADSSTRHRNGLRPPCADDQQGSASGLPGRTGKNAGPGRRPTRQPEDDSVDAEAHRGDRRGHLHAGDRGTDMDLVRPAPAPQEHHPQLQQAVPERRGDERSPSGRMERDRRRGRHDHLRRRHRSGRGTQSASAWHECGPCRDGNFWYAGTTTSEGTGAPPTRAATQRG